MKKILLVAIFSLLMAGLTATATMAASRPGCDEKRNAAPATNEQGTDEFDNTTFLGVQEAQAQSARVRDRGTARQIHHQNDNGPGMTCFDHAMALTSRLGQLFSDLKPTTPIPAASIRSFGQSSYNSYGTNSWLSGGLNVVITKTLNAHAGNFAPNSLSYALGATSFPFMASFMSTLSGFINTIMGFVGQITSYVNTLNNLWTYFQQIVDLLNGMIPTSILVWVPIIVNFWNSVVLPMINATIAAVMSSISGVINSITSTIMGAVGSLTNYMNPQGNPAGTPGGGECARIQNLWGVGGGFPNVLGALGAGNFQTDPLMRALTGSGVQVGNPYFSFSSMLLSGGAPPNLTGLPNPAAGKDFLNEMQLAQPALNKDMITRAQGNLTGALSGPGSGVLKSWTTPPTGYTNGAQSAINIIGQM